MALPVFVNTSLKHTGGALVKLIVSGTIQVPVSGGGHLEVSTVIELDVRVHPYEFVTTTKKVVAAFIVGVIVGPTPEGLQANEYPAASTALRVMVAGNEQI